MTIRKAGRSTVAGLFFGARKANLVRHAAKGTLVSHLLRKAWIKAILKVFPFPGR